MDLFSASTSLAFICYLIATLAILTKLLTPKGPNLTLVLIFGAIAIISQITSLSQLLLINHSINFNLPNVISLVSLLITTSVSLTAIKYKTNLLLPVTYGFVAMWQLVLLFIPPVHLIELAANNLAIISHVSIALIAYCILVIATLYAFQVSYINAKLKGKNLSAVNHLPPLMQVEKQLFMILTAGTCCLLLSEIVGFLFLHNFFAKAQLHKTVLSLIALSLYIVTLWGHYQQGWRGHRVLVLTTTATSLLTLAYFGSRFVKEFLLS